MAFAEFRVPGTNRLQFSATRGPLNLRQKIVFDATSAGEARRVGGNRNSQETAFYVSTFDTTVAFPVVAFAGAVECALLRVTATSITVAFQRAPALAEIYLFAPGVNYQPGSGFEIRNPATQEVVFTAFDKPVKPVFVSEFATENQAPGYLNFTNPSGRKVAVVLNSRPRYNAFFDDNGEGNGEVFDGFTFTNGAQAVSTDALILRFRLPETGEPATSYVTMRGYATVIDVQGY